MPQLMCTAMVHQVEAEMRYMEHRLSDKEKVEKYKEKEDHVKKLKEAKE